MVQTQPNGTSCATQRWAYALAIAWVAAVLCGLFLLWHYANTPAGATESLAKWPENSQISLDPNLPTLVLFVHPHCPCTRATIAELARIAAKAKGRFTGCVVLYKPSDSGEAWEQTDIVRSAEEIPGMRVVV